MLSSDSKFMVILKLDDAENKMNVILDDTSPRLLKIWTQSFKTFKKI